MELCTTRALSTPPLPPSLSSRRLTASFFRFYPSLPLHGPLHLSGVRCRTSTVLKVSADDESSNLTDEWRDRVATLEDVPSLDNDITLDKVSPVFTEYQQPEQPQSSDSSSGEKESLPFQEILDNLNIKLDSEDSYKILLYGSGALVALWLLSAIVGAIDSIPLVPKLMEVVGLGYSVWFTTRYLLFKKDRAELAGKIDELKQEVLGSNDG